MKRMNCNKIDLMLINPKTLICIILEFIREKNKTENFTGYVITMLIILTLWFVIALFIFNIIGNKPIFEYSKGEITGKAVKLSTKGLIFKTTEGYLMTGGIDNGTATKWEFTVIDNKLTKCINSNNDVILTYTQYLLVPYRIGNTHYIVTNCKEKKDKK